MSTQINMAPGARRQKRPAVGGTHIITPKGLESRYGWSAATRWRAEKSGRIPARDVFIGGVAAGWRPETLDAAERNEAAV